MAYESNHGENRIQAIRSWKYERMLSFVSLFSLGQSMDVQIDALVASSRKKLSTFSNYHDWDHSSNYIAKRYIDDVPMARYFDDVMMQMTTKLWATYYNQHNPPKKVRRSLFA